MESLRLTGGGIHCLTVTKPEHQVQESLAARILELPSFSKACYWAAFQQFDPLFGTTDGSVPTENWWPDGCNRIQPLTIADFSQLTPYGLFCLIACDDGKYLALLPLVGSKTVAWFESDNGRLKVVLGNLGYGAIDGECPLLAWEYADDPYEACYAVWKNALHHPLLKDRAHLRSNKAISEPFHYLGWCTYEEFRLAIDEQMIKQVASKIVDSGLPIRYLLIDEGHVDVHNRQLVSNNPNDRFPSGWNALVPSCKASPITWLGLWLNANGYWAGCAESCDCGLTPDEWVKNTVEAYRKKVTFSCTMPAEKAAKNFYANLVKHAKDAQFDFVKIDNQANTLRLYRGTEQPVSNTIACQQAMHTVCDEYFSGAMINCMAHNSVCAFNSGNSAITRCSEDYEKGNTLRAKRHLHNSYGNMPWLGQTVWGDHDMFHSSDPIAGEMMAISKAISGGPIYLSDNPEHFDHKRIGRLCFNDGRLLRPLAPAAPLPDSIFINPAIDDTPLRVIAPLSHGNAAIVCYNLTDNERAMECAVNSEDYQYADSMQQPWPGKRSLPEEGVVCYDWFNQQVTKLDRTIFFPLNGFTSSFHLLCPVYNGCAIIGCPDKFLSPSVINNQSISDTTIVLDLYEPLTLLLWRSHGSFRTDEPIDRIDEHLWRITPKQKKVVVELRQ